MRKTTFEWDEEKDKENQAKHGVSFVMAQQAFPDPNRVIAEDTAHSTGENRYYCMGRVGEGILDCQVYIPRQRHSYLWRRLLEKRKENL